MSGKKGCFKPGTKISTPDGNVSIENIKVGDKVLAFDINGKVSEGYVTETFKHNIRETKDKIIEIAHEKGSFYPTTNHWILNEDTKTFKEASGFDLGEYIILEYGTPSKIIDIINHEPVEYTYNLSVEPQHTFIADGVRVHNKGGSKGGSRTPVEAPNSLQSVAFIRIVDLISEGEIEGLVNGDGRDIYFDDTPIATNGSDWNFDDVVAIGKSGTAGQSYITGKFVGSSAPIDVSTEITVLAGPIVKTVTDVDVDAVKILFTIPALKSISSKTGDINETIVELKIEIQPDGGGYADVKTVTFSGKCNSAYQRQILIKDLSTYGSVPYNIRVSRITADSETSTLINNTWWTNYTELIYEKLYYPHSAYMAIEARADQFNNVPQRKYHVKGIKVRIPSNYNPVTRNYSPVVWDGTFAASRAYTNNPAWILYEIFTNNIYGYGREDSEVDKAALYNISLYNDAVDSGGNFVGVDDGDGGTEPRFTFNTHIQQATEAYTLANMIASSMRSMIFWSTGKAYISQDSPKDAIINVTNSSVEDGVFNYVGTERKNRHTQIAVTWNDPNDYYRPAVEFIDDREGINRYGIRRFDTTAYGCTSRGQARRWGKWILDVELNSTEQVTYIAGLDHAGIVPGDVISVTDSHFQGVDVGGRLVSATIDSVTLDREVTLDGVDTYYIQVTLPDNTIQKREVSDGVGSYITLNTVNPFSDIPQTESNWQLVYTLEPREFRVISKDEPEKNKYQILGVFHDPDKYARVDTGQTFDAPVYTTIPDSNVLDPPTNFNAEEHQATEGQNRMFNVLLSWEHSADSRKIDYEVQQRRDLFSYKTDGRTIDNSYVIKDVISGTYFFRIRTLGMTGKSEWVTYDDFEVFADTTAAVDVTGLQVKGGGTTFDGKHCEIEWDEITFEDEADFKDYRIEIMTTGDVHLRWMYPTENTVVYTYQMNTEDNSGTPIRQIKVRAWCRDIYDSLSNTPAVDTFSNPIPDMSSTLPVVTPEYGYLQVTWANVADNDMSHYIIYSDTTSVPITEVGTSVHPNDGFKVQGILSDTVYYVQIEPYDDFGVGTKSQIPSGASPLQIVDIDVEAELSQSITATDSDSNSAATLAKLYDRNYGSDGVGYTVAGTDKYIDYTYKIDNYFDRVAVWTADANASVYCAVYDRDTETWTYYKDAGDDTNLVAASNQADAQANLWDLDETTFDAVRRNLRIMPNNIVGSQFRIYIRGTYSTTFYEFMPSRIIISELAAIENLSAISVKAGDVITGTLSSEDWAAAAGMRLDLTNKWLKMGGSNVTAAGAAAGVFLGLDTTYKTYIGDGSNNYFKYDSLGGIQLSSDATSAVTIKSGGDIVVEDGGNVNIQDGGSIIIEDGGDVIMESSAGSTSDLNIVCDARTFTFRGSYNFDYLSVISDTDGLGTMYFGYDIDNTTNKRPSAIRFYTKDEVEIFSSYDAVSYSQIRAYSDPDDNAIFLRVRSTDENARIEIITSLSASYVHVQADSFRPFTDSATTCGTSSKCWSNIYGDAGVTSCSDQKWKINVKESPLGLSFINNLDVIQWEWDKNKGKSLEKTWHGILAQDVLQVLEDMGYTNEDFGGVEINDIIDKETQLKTGENWGFRYEQLIAPLCKAVQELSAEVELLKSV